MSEYVITINSTSDLPKEWVWERKIPVVPLNCTIGGNTYRDMYDLSADEFYGMLRAGEMAVTSQPSPQAAIDMLEPILKEGKDILIGFNPRFLMDALRVIDEEEITIYMINPKAPCFIRDKEESYIYLILPVNFNV